MIKEIIYFNDYSLYSKCHVEAAKAGKKYIDFLVEICLKNLPEKNYKNPLEFWIACESEAKRQGCTVSDFIEACFAHEIDTLENPKQEKRSFMDYFDLNYGARRRR